MKKVFLFSALFFSLNSFCQSRPNYYHYRLLSDNHGNYFNSELLQKDVYVILCKDSVFINADYSETLGYQTLVQKPQRIINNTFYFGQKKYSIKLIDVVLQITPIDLPTYHIYGGLSKIIDEPLREGEEKTNL